MRRVFLFGVIAYSLALLIMQDWPSMINSSGTASLPFLVLMMIDILFAGAAVYKMVGSSMFEDASDSIDLEDIEVPDTWFYGLFAADIISHLGWHGYSAVMMQGASSFYYSIWVMVEFVAMLMTWLFFRHAAKVAQREARRRSAANTVSLRGRDAI